MLFCGTFLAALALVFPAARPAPAHASNARSSAGRLECEAIAPEGTEERLSPSVLVVQRST